MASLLGKADSTLAAMSYKEAMADVAPDLKSVYQDEVLNQAMFQKGVEDYFDKLYADNNLLADQLKEATTLAMADLGTDYEGMELFNDELHSMKERMKALPKGKKGDFERAKIRGELVQLKKSTDGMEATLETLGTMIKAGDFDQHATGKVNLSLLNAIASGDANREIINGDLFYSIPNPAGGDDIKIDQQMLKDMLIQKDPEFESNFNKIHEGENALGKQKGNKFDRQGSVNKYEASFPSKAAFATNVNNKQGSLKYSFKDALMGKDVEGTLKLDSIYETLMSMGNKENFFNGSDKDQDGDVDAQDFAHKENGIALIESLTDIHSGNFNYQVAKKVAAEFYADNISANEFQDGVNMRVVETSTSKPKNRNVNIDMFLHEGDKGRSKFTTTSDTIIKWNEDLQAMKKTGKDSMSNEAYVNINGVKYGYDPRNGFREVEDISTSYGLSYKHDTRYFKTPEDIFQYHNIPTVYVGESGSGGSNLG